MAALVTVVVVMALLALLGLARCRESRAWR